MTDKLSLVQRVVVTNLASPAGIKTYAVGISAVVVAATSALKQAGVPIPAIDMDGAQSWITMIVGAGFITLRYGVNTIGRYVVSNILPLMLESVKEIIQREIAANLNTAAPAQAAPTTATPFFSSTQLLSDNIVGNSPAEQVAVDAMNQYSSVLKDNGINLMPNSTSQAIVENSHTILEKVPELLARLEATFNELARAQREAASPPTIITGDISVSSDQPIKL